MQIDSNSSDEKAARRGGEGSQTLYRKWRSQTFQELVGQEAITRTLKNAISSGRIGHAYLFCGPRGTGKTSTGRLLAKAVNCLDEDVYARPCDKCEACRSIAEARALDLIEIDAASNRGIDEVRELRDKINFQPSFLRKKVYIIDEAHMMTEAAFNALLKTLEEPPSHALFILATTDPQDIPATVVSRCQRFDFQRIGLDQIVGRLAFICEQEGITAQPAALEMVARQATGSLRDALSLLDQLIVYSGGVITIEAVRLMLGVMNTEAVADFVESLATSDMAGGLDQINRLVQAGSDLKRFNRELVEHLRNLMLLKANPNSRELTDMTVEAQNQLQDQARRLELSAILGFLKVFSGVDYNLKVSPYGQLPLEIALMDCLLRPAPAQNVVVFQPPATLNGNTNGNGVRPQAATPRPTGPEPRAAAPVRPQPAPVQNTPKPAETPPPVEPKPVNVPVRDVEAPSSNGTPPPQSETLAAVLELTSIVRVWPDALRSIKAQSAMTAALLEYTKPVGVKGNRVSLAFSYEFHRNRISQDATRRNVEDHLSRVVGQRVIIECIDQGEGGDDDHNGPSNAPRPVTPPPTDDFTRNALDIFNAKLV